MEINLLNILDFFNFRKDLKSSLGTDLIGFIKNIFIDQHIFFHVEYSNGEKMLWKADRMNDKFEIIDIFDINNKNTKKIFGQKYSKKDFIYISSQTEQDNIISKLGCTEKSSNKFMKMFLDDTLNFGEKFKGFKFENLEKAKNEGIRCDLQNAAFFSNKRTPLRVRDVRYEMGRKCYIPELSYFIKKDSEYLGYGQILFLDNKYTISNFCIKPLHQGKGIGTTLLKFLLYKAKDFGLKEIYIKVKSDNLIACKLYEGLGFETFEKTSFYEI
ncbi:MAG: GNAT family N-acetyltransferase [Sarcina sp.]